MAEILRLLATRPQDLATRPQERPQGHNTPQEAKRPGHKATRPGQAGNKPIRAKPEPSRAKLGRRGAADSLWRLHWPTPVPKEPISSTRKVNFLRNYWFRVRETSTFVAPLFSSAELNSRFLKGNVVFFLHMGSARVHHKLLGRVLGRASFITTRFVHAKLTVSNNDTFQRVSRARRTHISKIKCRFAYAKHRHFLENTVSCRPNTYFGWQIAPSRAQIVPALTADAFYK